MSRLLEIDDLQTFFFSSAGVVKAVAPYLPTRGAAELMWAAVGDHSPNPVALLMLGVWTVVMGAFAALAYRRDQGLRFR